MRYLDSAINNTTNLLKAKVGWKFRREICADPALMVSLHRTVEGLLAHLRGPGHLVELRLIESVKPTGFRPVGGLDELVPDLKQAFQLALHPGRPSEE